MNLSDRITTQRITRHATSRWAGGGTLRWAGFGALALLAYLPPLLTARGRVSADTKSYLYLDPGRLLERAPSMWDPNIGMGTVTHQNIGYLFPMGPYYWSMDRLGVPDWVAQRLWLGSLIFAAALGVLCLARHLGRTGPGVVVAALAYAFSPYSLHYSARLSVLLMPWAALGFVIALVIRSLREGGWRAPLLFAVVVQIVGGVNATALVFAGIAPILWVVWAWLGAREVSLRRALAAVGRIGAATIAMSLWWIAGLAAQSGYGIDILRYTETVAVVARTSTPNEVLRGLGYWFFYGRDRLGSWVEGSTSFTQSPGLIALTYGLVALALVGGVTVRWRHRGYFTWLLLVGTIVAVGAHPFDSPTPLGAVFKAFATSSTAGLALRSTPRAVPLVTLATAMLLGAFVDAAVARARSWSWPRPRVLAIAVVVGALVLSSFPPLWNGSFYGDNLLRDEDVPGYWSAALAEVDRGDRQSRVLEIPGADFAAYHWGDTVDPISPGLIDRPYVARELIPYGSPASADLLNALDRRLQEGTLDASAFLDLLRRMGIGTVIVRNDLEWLRYNLARPREIAWLLREVRRPDEFASISAFGRRLPLALDSPLIGAIPVIDERSLTTTPKAMPAPVLVIDIREPGSIVTATTVTDQVLISGDGEGLIDATAAGALSADATTLYAASMSDAELRAELERSALVVVTDSNRRRGRRWSTLRDNLAETEAAGQRPLDDDLSDARLPIFSDDPLDEPADDQSVVEYLDTGGPAISTIRATGTGNPIAFTPEDRPARAFDGDLNTSWKTSAFDRAVGDRIELSLRDPVVTDRVGVVQVRNGPVDRYITRVRLRFDAGDPVDVTLGAESRTANGQVVAFGERSFARLTVEVLATNRPDGPLYSGQSAVGFAEIAVTDHQGRRVRAHEVVRVPRDATDAITDRTGRAPDLAYVFSRLRTLPVPPRYDEELSLDRRFDVPKAGRFDLAGHVRFDPNPYERERLDAAIGARPIAPYVAVRSSGVMPGCIACLAGGAFDSEPSSIWRPPIGEVEGSWIEVEAATEQRYDHLDLTLVADGRHSIPTRLRLTVDEQSIEVDVPPVRDHDEENATETVRVRFPAARGRRLRVTVAEIDSRRGASYYDSNPRDLPVGVVEVGLRAIAFAYPGFAADPETGEAGECRNDLVRLDGRPVSIRLSAAFGAWHDRRPMAFTTCNGYPLELATGTHTLTTARGVDTALDVDRIVLRSSSPRPKASPEPRVSEMAPRAEILESGRTTIRVHVAGAGGGAWLRLGQSYNPGWRARVVGRESLGSPVLVDGYANGWRIPPGDNEAEVVLEWMPQRRVNRALWLSLVSAIAGLAVLVVTRRRRGRVALPAIEPVGFVTRRGDISSPTWPTTAFAALGGGVAGALVVGPAVGVFVAIATACAVRWRTVRTPLAALAPVLFVLAGAYVTVQQIRFRYLPIFEWPTLFPRARTISWVAALLPAIVWLVDEIRARHAGRGATASSASSDPR